ncbi:MAG: 30S ribosomal protein S10 [Puniceicoccales bacterium]|jgi:small subunit ribosomal protein S10|nr:30S ribosomal protein S10 [Puniceicoccales bacterium]
MTYKNKIRIRLKSFDSGLIDKSSAGIADTAKRSGVKVVGPLPLPNKKEIFTVNRSPHKDKKSMDQYELRTHDRMIEIHDPTVDTIESLKKLNLPAGVEISINA